MVTQGFNGKFSHQGNSLNAIDFACKIGTKIYAARAGTVVNLKNNGYLSGMQKSFATHANFVTIKHRDGTYGKYAHFKKEGVKVKLGQSITKAQFLGYCGKTGYVTGPHLHFVVFKAKDSKRRESIRIKFKTQEGIISNPIKGKVYTAYKEMNMNQAIKNLAATAIRNTLSGEKLPSKEEYLEKFPKFNNKAATFITLKQKGILRGCIGSLVAHQDLYDDIVNNAKKAAFNDPRFSPLKQDELKLTTFEISILSQAILVKYEGKEELKSKITIGKHGVILKHDSKQATFLPQVWDDLKTFEVFFEHLCKKAGLPTSCLDQNPSVYLYEVQKVK
jgi:AmmeMemoRadiSam system protein A